MIYFIRKYYKYIFIIFSIVLVFTCCYVYYENDNSNDIKVTKDEKLSTAKEEDINEKDDSKSVFVDIKGAINTPGVYELDESKRVIDQTTLNMIQDISSIIARKPMIIGEI